MICTCRDPLSLGVVHRADAPCYIPEQRTWVGLTYEDLPEQYKNDSVFVTGWLWAEAKLKQKNGYAEGKST